MTKGDDPEGINEKALYTFDGLADTRSDTLVGNRLGWENLLTGMLERSSDTPSVLERLKALDGESRIAVLASEREFSDLCKDEAVRFVGVRMSKSQKMLRQYCRLKARCLH